jgi:hypothetical protein
MKRYLHSTLAEKKSTINRVNDVAYNGTVNFVKRNGSERGELCQDDPGIPKREKG